MGNSTKFEQLMTNNPNFLNAAVYAWFVFHWDRNWTGETYKYLNAYRVAGGNFDGSHNQWKARDRLARNPNTDPRLLVRRAMKLGFIEQAMEVSRRLDQIRWPP